MVIYTRIMLAAALLATSIGCLAQSEYIAAPTFSSGGASAPGRTSTNYIVTDTMGQFAAQVSSSANYGLQGGYWHPTITFAAVSSPSFNSGGVSAVPRVSANYRIDDSMGQFVVALSNSADYGLQHGMWHSSASVTLALSPGGAKAIGNGSVVQLGSVLDPMVVTSGTSVFSDRFYVESTDRSGGIAVQYGSGGGPALSEGDRVYVTGTMDALNSERIIDAASAVLVAVGSPLLPLYIGAPSLGGGRFNVWTPGVLSGVGLSNIGLLVKSYTGPVTYRDPLGAFFYVDNGDGLNDGFHAGIRVICNDFAGSSTLTMPNANAKVSVKGISSLILINSQAVRALRPRYQADIQAVQ